jgi:hypothetical protein
MESTRAVFTRADQDRLQGFVSANLQRQSREQDVLARYDEVDVRLMDTFPASDAVARY